MIGAVDTDIPLEPVLELVGVFVGAMSGALAAVRKQFDVFGIIVLAWAAGLGGGILRDVLIGAVPPVGISNWRFIATAVAGATLIYFFHPRLERARRFIVVLDAGALALFSVVGTIKGLEYGTTLTAAVIVGVMTGVGGGVLRDLLSGEVPVVLHHRQLYAIPALLGSTVTAILWWQGVDHHRDERGRRDRGVRAAGERPAVPAEGAGAVAGDGALTARCEDGRVNPDSPDQVRTLMEVAEPLAREAGALVRDGRRRLVTVAATKSSDQDVVTAMDLASESLLRQPAGRAAAATTRSSARRRPSGRARPASPGWWTRSTARSTTCTGRRPTRCRSPP